MSARRASGGCSAGHNTRSDLRPGTNNEIFAVLGDGQLRRWKKGEELTPVQSLFEKPESDDQRVVKPAFASFSPDGQWLLTIPPTRVSVVTPDGPVQGGTQQRATISPAYPGLGFATSRSGDGRRKSAHTSLWERISNSAISRFPDDELRVVLRL